MLIEADTRTVRQLGHRELQLGLNLALRAAADQRSADAEDLRTTPDPVSRERLQLANAGSVHLSPIVRRLVELWHGPEDDDYGRLRPTRHAFDTPVRLLVDAAIDRHVERREIPYGCVSTDSAGGVRIEWIRQGVSVHLIVPATEHGAAFVYHEVGGDYATEDATPERLSYWLRAIT